MRLLLLVSCLSTPWVQSAITNPFVVLPPFLRTGTSNTILVTPIKTNADNVDITLTVNAVSGNTKTSIYSQKFKAKRAGSSHSFNFEINSKAELAQVHVQVSRHADFLTEIRIRPDVGAVHIHTSKNLYRAGESVDARVLPLNGAGNIFPGPVDVALVNPDGYELTRHRIAASNNFVPLRFELPLHLFFGDWRIVARPAGYRDSDLTYESSFSVRDYELPPFQLKVFLAEDDPLEKTGITVEARFSVLVLTFVFSYFHGAPVDGTLVIYCTPHSKNQSAQTHRLLQTEVSAHYE